MRPKVLFIDDDPIIHALYKPHMERAGYEVVGLLAAEDAVAIACRDQPRVVVLDMILPGQDGLTTIVQLKAAEATKKIPIISISADLNLHGMRQQLQGLGVCAFLSKPFGAAKLVAEIARLAPLNEEALPPF